MISSSSSCSILLQKLKFRRKNKRNEEILASDDFEISTEDEEHYLDLSSSTLSCLNYLEYPDDDLNDKVTLVNRSKSFQETGVIIPLLRKQRVCKKCHRSSNNSKMSDDDSNGWTFIELTDNDLNVFCDNKRCRLIKKKRFYDRFLNQIRNISQGYRKGITSYSPDERGELILSLVIYLTYALTLTVNFAFKIKKLTFIAVVLIFLSSGT